MKGRKSLPLAAALALALALAWAPRAAGAQPLTIVCVPGAIDGACEGRVAVADSVQYAEIVLRVERAGAPVQGAIVRFRATDGGLQPDSTTTDAGGVARTMWLRGKGAAPVAVAAQAFAGGDAALRYIRLSPGPVPPRVQVIRLQKHRGFLQSWFEKNQLPRAVQVELRKVLDDGSIVAIGDRATCGALRVTFTRRGAPATTSPDTATASVDGDHCYALTYWSLGEGIGERELDATVVPSARYQGDSPVTAFAWARATPRFVAGFTRTRLRSYVALNPAPTRTVHVEQVDASGTKRTYDVVEKTGVPTIDTVDARTDYGAVAAVSVPIPIARLEDWDGLSLTAGVDLANPRDRMFFGISLLRLLGKFNPVIESLPVDFHALGTWVRQEEVKDLACARDVTTCTVEKRRHYQGISYMLSADATSLISELVKRLVP